MTDLGYPYRSYGVPDPTDHRGASQLNANIIGKGTKLRHLSRGRTITDVLNVGITNVARKL